MNGVRGTNKPKYTAFGVTFSDVELEDNKRIENVDVLERIIDNRRQGLCRN